MAKKSFEIVIELDIFAVTCPGVWLCHSGKLTLQLCILNQCGETSKQRPVFPMLIHEKFVFHKIFHSACSLSDLHRMLQKENVCFRLLQTADCDTGCILATFETSLASLLYPTFCNKNLRPGNDIDLLMETTKCFPGIIAPKIEICTKTLIEETFSKCRGMYCKCDTHVAIPKVITSRRNCQQSLKQKQKCVCHSTGYHGYKTDIRGCLTIKGNDRPPFAWRRVDDNIFDQQKYKKSKCPCRLKKTDRRKEKIRSTRPPTPPEDFRNTMCELSKGQGCKRPQRSECDYCLIHNAKNCTVCIDYSRVFNACLPTEIQNEERQLSDDRTKPCTCIFERTKKYISQINHQGFANCLNEDKTNSMYLLNEKINCAEKIQKKIHDRVKNVLNICGEYPFVNKSNQYEETGPATRCYSPLDYHDYDSNRARLYD